ncbi:MAG TPA: hypothetical protein PK289_13920 [Bacteroidia bacterium]|nr:hypothetical protein [Bacteroidia bacterium]
MDNLPISISLFFGITTLLTVFLFYKATQKSYTSIVILLLWLLLQAIVARTGFYTFVTQPPRFPLLVGPTFLFIILLFVTAKGRNFIDTLDGKALTLLHIVRIPVEMVLFWLFLCKTVPQEMTFEGRNLDIISGLSAPFIYYFGYVKQKLSRPILLCWNFLCLGLLTNIVLHAIFALPGLFQTYAFDQPNIAVMYFPFVWLPCCIVPLVLFSHLACIRQLLKKTS